MSEKKHGCLKNTAIGCGLMLILAIAIPFIGGYFMMRPFREAVDARTELDQRFGSQDEYVPSMSGAVPPDRIAAFLDVRERLLSVCTDMQQVEQQIMSMERFDEQEDVSRTEVLKEALKTTKSAMSMGPLLGELFAIRNQALLDVKMGLGEFTYIWTVAYHEQILNPPEESELFGPGPLNHRVRNALRSMLINQHNLVKEQNDPSIEIAGLVDEIAALENDTRRVLWQEGLPAAVSESIAPFRKELDELYCPSTAPLELMINVSHGGIAIETE